MLRDVHWWLIIEVSGQPIGSDPPGTDRLTRNVWNQPTPRNIPEKPKPQQRHVWNQMSVMSIYLLLTYGTQQWYQPILSEVFI